MATNLSVGLTVLLVASSGCIEATEDLAAEVSVPAEQSLARSPADRPGGNASEAEPPVQVEVPVKWQGKVAAGACAAIKLGFGACYDVTPSNNRFEIPFDGDLKRVYLELKWAPTTPITQELGFSVTGFSKEKKPQAIAYVKGSSPVIVDVGSGALDVAGKVYFTVSVPAQVAPPGDIAAPIIGVTFEQPVGVEGALQAERPGAS